MAKIPSFSSGVLQSDTRVRKSIGSPRSLEIGGRVAEFNRNKS